MSVDLKYVNKFNEQTWHARTLFSNFNVRIQIKEKEKIIKALSDVALLTKYLRRDGGTEDVDWFTDYNPATMQNEFYLTSAAPLMLWRLQEKLNILELIGEVEQHTTDENLLNENTEEGA